MTNNRDSERLFSRGNLIYWAVIAIIILLEQVTFGRWWKRREAHRWTMGYATVFGLGLPLIIRRKWDFPTYAGLFVGVGISGMIKTGMEALLGSWRAENLRREGAAIYATTTNRWRKL